MGRYLHSGSYMVGLTRYLEYFPRHQMHISLQDDLRDDPQDLVRDLFAFVGVDRNFQPDTSHRHNASGIIRNKALRYLWTQSGRMRAVIGPLFSERFRHEASEWVIRDLERIKLDPSLRAELTEYYRPGIAQLQDFLGRDLGHWLKSGT